MLRRSLALAVMLAALLAAPALAADATRPVLYVGNNWDGTADVVDPFNFQKLAHLNIVPDKAERLAEIMLDPAPPRLLPGHPGAGGRGPRPVRRRHVHLPRRPLPLRLAAEPRRRRRLRPADGEDRLAHPVEGYRADHMAISPDGKRLLVSASTAKVVDVIDTADGKIVDHLPPGDQPHENNYSRDGKLIYHASIGTVYTPFDEPRWTRRRASASSRSSTPARSRCSRRIDMGQKLSRGRLSRHELGGAADGALARRALPLLPGLVLPRLRRVRPPAGQGAAPGPAAAERGGREAPRGLPARLGPPRARDEPERAPSCAPPARCRTTRRSSPAHLQRQDHPGRHASPTGRPTAATGATASSRSAATTTSRHLLPREASRSARGPRGRPPAADADGRGADRVARHTGGGEAGVRGPAQLQVQGRRLAASHARGRVRERSQRCTRAAGTSASSPSSGCRSGRS